MHPFAYGLSSAFPLDALTRYRKLVENIQAITITRFQFVTFFGDDLVANQRRLLGASLKFLHDVIQKKDVKKEELIQV
jgi:hypothetical protein